MTTTAGEVRMAIDGKLVEAKSGKRFDNVNPATEEVLGPVADASPEDMQDAIAAARRAFDETDWSTNHAFRKQCLEQLQAAIESEKEELRAELVREVGTPVALTYGPQLDAPLEDGLLWPAAQIEQFPWSRELPDGHAFGGNAKRWVVKEPAGVVGAIVPWNFPFEVSLQKIGQALATGNTMILKPAPDTPWNATRLGRLVLEHTDIPPGVFNVVTSSDHMVGEELVVDPRVDLISFTGSTATGRRIMEKGAATMKRLFLELGGKSADIVLDDADIPAKMASAFTICIHGGQGCAIPTRLLVPRSHYDEAVELAGQAFANTPYGDPTDVGMLQGPQISAKQRDRVLGYIEIGGDLRPGARDDPVRGRRRRGAHRQRQRVRARGLRHVGERRARHGRRPTPACGLRHGQRRCHLRRGRALRRLQGEWHRPPERHRGLRAVPGDEDPRPGDPLEASSRGVGVASAMPPELAVHLQRVLPAPRSLVFRMHTEPARLGQWWGPNGFSAPSVDLDVRVGGSYRIVMQPPEGEAFVLVGEFREVEPDTRLSYTFRWEPPDPDDRETVAEFSLRDLGTSTALTVDHRGFATEARRALHEQGWSESLDRLDAVLTASER
jgi:aldehyde dehydrogenase (NAD+)